MKRLRKDGGYISDTCEAAPFVMDGRLLLMECIRPAKGRRIEDHYMVIDEPETRNELARFGTGYGLASVLVHQGAISVFASRWDGETWNDVTRFVSTDLGNWEGQLVLEQDPGEHLFNTSVCRAGDKFVLAYETNDPTFVPFTIKFAESTDLLNWTSIPGAILAPERYAACPCLRYLDGYFYVLYTEHLKPRWWFETHMVRSRDLRVWDPSPRNPILAPEEGEDVNTSDPDLVEHDGRVHLYYSIGDQRTYSKLKRATFEGRLREFLAFCYDLDSD